MHQRIASFFVATFRPFFFVLILVFVAMLHADTHEPGTESESASESVGDVAEIEAVQEAQEQEVVTVEESSGPDIADGESLAAPCMACHGDDGNALIPEYSNLAGQNEKYLFKQLELIKSGDRAIPLMLGQLDALEKNELRNIAAYYASLPGKIGQASDEKLELGESIYRGGILDKNVAACTACHAPNGNGNLLAGFPRVSGQPVEYTIAQLKAYREQERTSDEYVNGMMRDIAARLTDTEIAAVANYMTGLY